MPLKEEAARSVDDLDAASTRQRSVNTVVGIGSGHARGLSTDGAGFVNSLYAQDIALTGARASARSGRGCSIHCRCARCN